MWRGASGMKAFPHGSRNSYWRQNRTWCPDGIPLGITDKPMMRLDQSTQHTAREQHPSRGAPSPSALAVVSDFVTGSFVARFARLCDSKGIEVRKLLGFPQCR